MPHTEIEPETDIDENDDDLMEDDDGQIDDDDEGPVIHSYWVSTRTDRELVEGRDNAVAQAKEMTADGTSVQVERQDGRVRMQFRDGSLVEYVYETRKGRTV